MNKTRIEPIIEQSQSSLSSVIGLLMIAFHISLETI